MNPGLEVTMLRIFTAANWRETFTRTKGGTELIRKWLYDTYLRSNAWSLKKAQRKEMDNHRCGSPLCFRVDRLEVHHKTYERIGDEDVENDLITLCERCHDLEHSDEVTAENHPLHAFVRS